MRAVQVSRPGGPFELVERQWTRGLDWDDIAPSLDAQGLAEISRYYRRCASPGAAVALMKMNTYVDVRAVDDRAVERWFAQLGWMWTLGESADLIVKPGRLCSNGKPVPIQRADFQKFARDMRKAGLAVLEAVHTRNQQSVSDATNDLADACSNCHEVYRVKLK